MRARARARACVCVCSNVSGRVFATIIGIDLVEDVVLTAEELGFESGVNLVSHNRESGVKGAISSKTITCVVCFFNTDLLVGCHLGSTAYTARAWVRALWVCRLKKCGKRDFQLVWVSPEPSNGEAVLLGEVGKFCPHSPMRFSYMDHLGDGETIVQVGLNRASRRFCSSRPPALRLVFWR